MNFLTDKLVPAPIGSDTAPKTSKLTSGGTADSSAVKVSWFAPAVLRVDNHAAFKGQETGESSTNLTSRFFRSYYNKLSEDLAHLVDDDDDDDSKISPDVLSNVSQVLHLMAERGVSPPLLAPISPRSFALEWSDENIVRYVTITANHIQRMDIDFKTHARRDGIKHSLHDGLSFLFKISFLNEEPQE